MEIVKDTTRVKHIIDAVNELYEKYKDNRPSIESYKTRFVKNKDTEDMKAKVGR